MQRRIQQRDGVRQRKPARGLQWSEPRTSPEGHAGSTSRSRKSCSGGRPPQRASKCCLYWAPRPRSGCMVGCRDHEARQLWSGEDRHVRQTELCGVQPHHWRLGDLMPGVEATTKSPPARAEQLRSRHAMPAGLFDSERTSGQFRRNARSRRHAENAGRCAAQEQRRLLTPSVGCARYQGVAIANGAHTRRC